MVNIDTSYGPQTLTSAQFAERFFAAMTILIDFVTRALRVHPKFHPIAHELYLRLTRTRNRVVRAIQLLDQPVRARKPRAKPTTERKPRKPRIHIPQGKMWLYFTMGAVARGFAHQLDHLLHQPGIADMLAQSAYARRTLRPLYHSLGFDLPVLTVIKPAKPKKPPKPRKPRAPRFSLKAAHAYSPNRIKPGSFIHYYATLKTKKPS